MICITNACKQHSNRCPTPWTCGRYEHDAHERAMTNQLREAQEPLGAEFQKVLDDNRQALYSKDDAPLYAPLRDAPPQVTLEGPEPDEPTAKPEGAMSIAYRLAEIAAIAVVVSFAAYAAAHFLGVI